MVQTREPPPAWHDSLSNWDGWLHIDVIVTHGVFWKKGIVRPIIQKNQGNFYEPLRMLINLGHSQITSEEATIFKNILHNLLDSDETKQPSKELA